MKNLDVNLPQSALSKNKYGFPFALAVDFACFSVVLATVRTGRGVGVGVTEDQFQCCFL
jgi:hypothetical protein